MSMFAKIMVVVNFVLAVVFLSAAGTLLSASEEWKAKYHDLAKAKDADIVALKAQVDAADTKSKELVSQRDTSQKNEAAADSGRKAIQEELDTLHKTHNALVASVQQLSDAQKDLQSKNASLNADLETKRNELASSETAKRDLEAKNKSLTESVAQAEAKADNAVKDAAAKEARLGEVANQNDQLQTELASYKKNFPHVPGGGVMKSAKGVVQAVDNKVDVYILSIGSKDGVAVGYEFTVFRGSEYVARVVVDKVWDNMASAHSLPNTRKRDIQAGDEISNNL